MAKVSVDNTINVSPAIKREQLKSLAVFLRKRFGYTPLQKFNPIDVMENIIPQRLDSEFCFVCTSVKEWPYAESVQAVCDYYHHNIEVREDVYRRAYYGVPVDVFTICHEVCHYILFHYFGPPVSYREIGPKTTTRKYNSPEWQANTLAGLLCVTDEMLEASQYNTEVLQQMSGLSKSSINFCKDLTVNEHRNNNRNKKTKRRGPMKNRKKSSY